jgi:hypothetical protein
MQQRMVNWDEWSVVVLTHPLTVCFHGVGLVPITLLSPDRTAGVDFDHREILIAQVSK